MIEAAKGVQEDIKSVTENLETIKQVQTDIASAETTIENTTNQAIDDANTVVDDTVKPVVKDLADRVLADTGVTDEQLKELANKVQEDENVTRQQAKDLADKVLADTGYSNESIKDLANKLLTDMGIPTADLKELYASLGVSSDVVDKATQFIIDAGKGAANGELDSKRNEVIKYIDTAIDGLETMQTQVGKNLTPQINSSMESLELVLQNSQTLMNNMASVLGGMGDIFGSLQVTASSATTSLEKTSEALGMISERLTAAIDKVENVAEGDKAKILMETLAGDPEMYGEFFAEPVHIETEVLYPVENYGSAVTPFYTTLAIWVGALILTAILKVHPDKSKYEGAKGWHLFFGRYALFFVMGQLQTLITVIGDLKLLHVQCLHPGYFWLASAVTSLIFSLLIYSLVSAFGDVGKAAAVVIVVLQIAGSSGTYPIELLPEFFQKVYIFFPFPYAINAMRESVAGFYEHDFVIYLLQLCLFIPVALTIGILIRRPFKKMNHFMEERMEETEMM